MYTGLMNLGIENYTAERLLLEQSAFCVQLAIGKLNSPNHQVSVKSQQKRLRQAVEELALRSINVLVLFGIRSN